MLGRVIDVGDIAAIIAAITAVVAVTRSRRADLRTELYRSRLEAADEIGRAIERAASATLQAMEVGSAAGWSDPDPNAGGTAAEEHPAIAEAYGEGYAATTAVWDEPLRLIRECSTTLYAWVPVLPAEVIEAASAYFSSIADALRANATAPTKSMHGARQSYHQSVRTMLGTDPLSDETNRLLTDRRWFRRS